MDALSLSSPPIWAAMEKTFDGRDETVSFPMLYMIHFVFNSTRHVFVAARDRENADGGEKLNVVIKEDEFAVYGNSYVVILQMSQSHGFAFLSPNGLPARRSTRMTNHLTVYYELPCFTRELH